MIVTVKGIIDGFIKVEIKPAVGERYYREFTNEALLQYLLDSEAYCEWKGYTFHFVVPEAIKKAAVSRWMENIEAANNNQ